MSYGLLIDVKTFNQIGDLDAVIPLRLIQRSHLPIFKVRKLTAPCNRRGEFVHDLKSAIPIFDIVYSSDKHEHEKSIPT